MPRRLLITFEAPIAVKSGYAQQQSPDGALVALESLPVSPAILPIQSSSHPSIAKTLMPKYLHQAFQSEQLLSEFLARNPLLLEGFHCLMNNEEIPNEIAVAFFSMDERLVAPQQQKVTFQEALKLLFIPYLRCTYAIVNGCYGVDLRTPLHRNCQQMSQFQKYHTGKQDIYKQFNYAAPDYLFSCVQHIQNINNLQFRQDLLQTMIQDGLLNEKIARFYSLKEIANCNVSLDDILAPADLPHVMKLLKNKIKTDCTQKIRISTSQELRYQISQLTIPEAIRASQIVILAVSTHENDKETLLQDPCDVTEFQTYSFDENDDADYYLHCVFQLKPIKNVLIQTLEQQSGLKKSKRANAANVSSSESYSEAIDRQKLRKQYGRRKSSKQEQQDQQELILAQNQLPEVFVANFDAYIAYYKQYNSALTFKHQLALNTNIQSVEGYVLDTLYLNHWYSLSSCKQFWMQTKEMATNLIHQQDLFGKAQYGGEVIRSVFTQFTEKLTHQLQQEIDSMGDKQRIQILLENPATLFLAQGHYSRALQYITLSRCFVDFYHTQKLQIGIFIQSLFLILRGINHMMYHRIGTQMQTSYVRIGDEQFTPAFYHGWAFSQLFGVGMLQVFNLLDENMLERQYLVKDDMNKAQQKQSLKNNSKKQIEEYLNQEEQDEEFEEYEENPPDQIAPQLQFILRHTVQSVAQTQSQINKQSIAYLVVKNTKLFEQDQASSIERINQLDSKILEDFNEPGDYVYGLAFYPPNCTISASINPFSSTKHDIYGQQHNQSQQDVVIYNYIAEQYRDDIVSQVQQSVQKMLDYNQSTISDDAIDNLIQLTKQPSTCPIRLVQTSSNAVHAAPTPNADFQAVSSYQLLLEKLKEFNYDVDQLLEMQSSSHAITNASEPQSTAKNDIFSIQMLDSTNNDKMQYISQEFEVNIPKVIIKRKYKTVAEFIESWGAQQLQSFGFDLANLALFADMQRFNQNYSPGIVFSDRLNQYMYLPLIQGDIKQQSSSKLLNINLYNQAVFLQNLVIQHYSWPVKPIEANILTLLDHNQINKKLATQLREYTEKGYSCNTYIGIIAQQVLDAYKYELKLHDLLGLDETEHKIIELNDIDTLQSEKQQQQPIQTNTQLEQFLSDFTTDQYLYQFVIDNIELTQQLFENSRINVQLDELNYLQCKHSQLELINQNKDFILTKKQIFCNYDLTQLLLLYSNYSSAAEIEQSNENGKTQYAVKFNQLTRFPQIVQNQYWFSQKQPVSARNFVYIGRIRGLQIARQLLQNQISPDSDIVQSQKNFGFVSVHQSEIAYQAIIQLLNDLQSEPQRQKAHGDQRTDGLFSRFRQICKQLEADPQNSSILTKHQPLTVPFNIDQINPLQQYYKYTKILVPFFKQYGIMQQTGQTPLQDIYGRVLRSKAPYQYVLSNSINNEPAPLEVEAPPPPAASGEESTMQHLIDFWENVKNKFFCIPDERIRALLSPLYALEEREIEFLETGSETVREVNVQDAKDNIGAQNVGLSCKCAEVAAVMYPNPSPGSLTLEQFQKGIYYMSPYYIPPSSDYEIERMKTFRILVKYVVTTIVQLLKQNLGEILQCPSTVFDRDSKFAEVVVALFVKHWPQQYYADHFRQEISDSRYQQFKSGSTQTITQLLSQVSVHNFRDINCQLIQKLKQLRSADTVLGTFDRISRVLEQYQTEFTFEQQLNDLQPCVMFIVKKHPILNIMTYSDPDDLQVIQPLDICNYLKNNKVGEDFGRDSAQLQSYLEQCRQRGKSDEILAELLRKQAELRVLERENLKQNVELHYRLQQCKWQDIQCETAELFCTAVNAAWGKLCAGDRASGTQKIGQDQLALGGFETNGPRGDYSASAELAALAERNGLPFGTWVWDKDTFDIHDVVDFSD